MIPKWIQKIEGIFGEMPLGAPLMVEAFFVIKKCAPSAPKVLTRLEKLAKNYTKEPPEYENELQKSTLFGAKRKCPGPADCAKRLQ